MGLDYLLFFVVGFFALVILIVPNVYFCFCFVSSYLFTYFLLIFFCQLFFLVWFLQGEDSVEYFLGLTPSGIVVLRDKTTVAYYYWPRIAKVYFKGRYFMLRVCDKNVCNEPYSHYLYIYSHAYGVVLEIYMFKCCCVYFVYRTIKTRCITWRLHYIFINICLYTHCISLFSFGIFPLCFVFFLLVIS